jgi:hypothetical protein
VPVKTGVRVGARVKVGARVSVGAGVSVFKGVGAEAFACTGKTCWMVPWLLDACNSSKVVPGGTVRAALGPTVCPFNCTLSAFWICQEAIRLGPTWVTVKWRI